MNLIKQTCGNLSILSEKAFFAMDFFPRAFDGDFSGATLLVPAVSIGCTSQAALEILLHNLSFPLVGYFTNENVLPCVGYNPLGTAPSKIALSLEMYKDPGSQLFLVQQRAPTIPGRLRSFAKNLVDWVNQQRFAKIIIVGSVDASLKRDSQILDGKLRFVSTQDSLSSWLTSAGLKELENELFEREEGERRVSPWPLVHQLRVEGMVACCIVDFVAESSNVADALTLAKVLNDLLGLSPGMCDWKLPPLLQNNLSS